MKKNVILSIILIFLLVAPMISAAEKDNIKFYDEETKTITIRDSILWQIIPTTKVIEIQLLSDLHHTIQGSGDEAYAWQTKINMYEDNYIDLIKLIETYNYDNLEETKIGTFTYKIYNPNGVEQIPVDGKSCITFKGQTTCDDTSQRFYNRTGTWEDFDPKTFYKGEIIIRAYWSEELGEDERIEWIPTIAGVRIEEWADFGTAERGEFHYVGTITAIDKGANYFMCQSFTVGVVGPNVTQTARGLSINTWKSVGGQQPTAYFSFWNTNGSGSPITVINYNLTANLSVATDINNWSTFDNVSMPDTTFLQGGTYAVCVNYTTAGNTVRWWNSADSYAGGNLYEGNDLDSMASTPGKDMGFFIWYEELGFNIANISMTFPQNITYGRVIRDLNYTVSANAQTCWYSLDGGLTNTSVDCGTNLTGLNSGQGSSTWSIAANTTDNFINISSTTFFVDSIDPLVTITSPLVNITDDLATSQDRTIRVNWTSFDNLGLASCWYYNNTANVTVTCGQNATFTLPYGTYTHIVYANDSLGHEAQDSVTISYGFKLLEESITYNNITVGGSLESFVLLANSTEIITGSSLVYNGTAYSTNILSLGGGSYQISSNIQVPIFSSSQNISFHFGINLADSSSINTSTNIQQVALLNIGNCSLYNELLFNATLFDEKTLADIEGTIEFNLDILNSLDLSPLSNVSTIFENVHEADVCSDLNITSSNYLYSLEIRYFTESFNSTTLSHVPEFYHIQQADISSLPQAIQLYDLAINESTEFTISYRDNDYIARENVLLQIMRKYVSEGIFRVIEIPITSSQGSAVGHFDLDNYKYKIIVTENGEVLNVFDNPAIRCESELSGICEINLKGLAETPSADYVSDLENFFYTVDQTNSSVIVDYSIPSGESQPVTITMTQESSFVDPIILCNQTIVSSAGSIECPVSPSIGDSLVSINIVSAGDTKGNLRAIFQEDLQTSFLLNNYFIAAIMLMTLILMFITSTKMMIGASIFGLIFLGLIFLLKSSSITLVVGAISWFIIAAIIILIKLNKKEEQ